MAEAEKLDLVDVDDSQALEHFVKSQLVGLVRSAKDDKVKLGTLVELGEFVRVAEGADRRPKQRIPLGPDDGVGSPSSASKPSLRSVVEARAAERRNAPPAGEELPEAGSSR